MSYYDDVFLAPPEDGPDFSDLDPDELEMLQRTLEAVTEDAEVPRRFRKKAQQNLNALRNYNANRTIQ